ncbi:MAG: alcohol dehydrogenase catalytic domain-containing protein [Phycisphaeraceae bacterium]|nr:alcohol dehydrogenase catalytic domain-containing protein [Phycisphaeraceae bacterium]
MKALQLQAVGKLELVDVPVPTIDDDQMLIKTGAAVICTSDLIDIRENPFGAPLPVVMGHEGAGTVAKLGRNVQGFNVGDRVATHPVHPCGQCPDCRSGRGHLCPSMRHFGLTLPGTFAEYYIVRADRARKVPHDVPFELAALAEPICVCLQALAQANLQQGGRLLILGDGPFGVLIAMLAHAMPLSKVVISGHYDFRLAFAPGVTLNTKGLPDPVAALRDQTDNLGYDAVILAVGRPDAVRDGLSLLRPKGRLVIFSPIPGQTPIDLFAVSCKELEIVGACNDQDRLDEAVKKLTDPSLNLSRLITHRFPLDRFRDAFDVAAGQHQQALKVALTFA